MTTKNIVRLLALAALLARTRASRPRPSGGPRRRRTASPAGHNGTITLSAQGGNGLGRLLEARSSTRRSPRASSSPARPSPGRTTRTTSSTPRAPSSARRPVRVRLRRQEGRRPARRSSGTRTPTGSPTRPARPTARPISGNTAIFHVPDGMRLALQNVYTPWVAPTSSNPAGVGSAPANPTVPGFFAVEPWVHGRCRAIDLRYVRKTGKAGHRDPAWARTSC